MYAYCSGIEYYRADKPLKSNPYTKDNYGLYLSWREGYLTEMRRVNRDKSAGALGIDCIKK